MPRYEPALAILDISNSPMQSMWGLPTTAGDYRI